MQAVNQGKKAEGQRKKRVERHSAAAVAVRVAQRAAKAAHVHDDAVAEARRLGAAGAVVIIVTAGAGSVGQEVVVVVMMVVHGAAPDAPGSQRGQRPGTA
jgi:hypothetical protein